MATEGLFDRKGWPYIWLSVILVFVGMILYMVTSPSIDWIMSHNVQEYLARAYYSFALFLIPGAIGAIINVYGLYLVFVKKEPKESLR